MTELTPGTLYQFYYEKDWRIGEFVYTKPAESYKYSSFYMDSMKIGPERIGHYPERHFFRKIAADGVGSIVWFPTKGAQIRAVTEETIAEIARLKERCKMTRLEEAAARKELRQFCG